MRTEEVIFKPSDWLFLGAPRASLINCLRYGTTSSPSRLSDKYFPLSDITSCCLNWIASSISGGMKGISSWPWFWKQIVWIIINNYSTLLKDIEKEIDWRMWEKKSTRKGCSVYRIYSFHGCMHVKSAQFVWELYVSVTHTQQLSQSYVFFMQFLGKADLKNR